MLSSQKSFSVVSDGIMLQTSRSLSLQGLQSPHAYLLYVYSSKVLSPKEFPQSFGFISIMYDFFSYFL